MLQIWRLFRVYKGTLRRRRAIPLAAAIIVFLLFATALARTKAPWCDEGWFGNPAYNLAFHGQMGSNVLEPSGHFLNAYLSGIKERTYIMVPNHMVALAGWFRIFGFSLYTMRAYSIIWGAVGLFFFFYILSELFPDPWVARLGTLLTAIDFVYLWGCADGRMESSSNALALASLAAYLHFRERTFTKAVCVSQILGAMAFFTHPNALVVLLTVPVLVWRLDRKRVEFRHFCLAAVPYLFFGGLWSLYILQSPADFSAQFFANAAGRNFARWTTVVKPWLAVWRELARHLATYSITGLWSRHMSAWMIFVPLIYLAAVGLFIGKSRTYTPSVRIFLTCLVTVILAMTFLNGFKSANYLVYLIPFYSAALAYWLLSLGARSPTGRAMAVVIGIAFASLEISASIAHVQADEYHLAYKKAIARLEKERAAGKTIIGTSALGFGLGFHGFADDWRLGLYSGLKPDILVLDLSYRDFVKWFETEEPQTFSHIATTITSNYRLSTRIGEYWIFERVDRGPTPWVDISAIRLKKDGEKAEYLFKQLSSSKQLTSNASIRF
jgi:hypothetical protein